MTASTRSTTSVLSRFTDVLDPMTNFLLENPMNLIKSSKTSVNFDKTEVVDLVDAVIFEPVAPRDHFSNVGL